MKSMHETIRLLAAGVWFGLTACNSLLDIERRPFVPSDGGPDAGGGPTTPEPSPSGSSATATTATSGSATEGDGTGSAPTEGATGSDSLSTTSGPLPTDATSPDTTPADATSVAPDPRETPPDAPNPSAALGCANKLDPWGHTTFCRFTPNGFDRNGNPLADVGDVHLWVYWSASSVAGWICVIDDGDNGRGIAYRVLVHPEGAELPALPADDVTPEGAWQLVYEGRDNEKFGTCDWVKFEAALAVDQVMVEWLDLWTSRHFDGRYFVPAP